MRIGVETVSRVTVVVAVHGMRYADDHIRVGGLDGDLRGGICAALNQAGFSATAELDSEYPAQRAKTSVAEVLEERVSSSRSLAGSETNSAMTQIK